MDHNVFLKMSLMSVRIHKEIMELEGAQLLEVFKELDDGDLKEEGGGGGLEWGVAWGECGGAGAENGRGS